MNDDDELAYLRLVGADMKEDEVLWSLDLGEDYILYSQVIDDILYVMTANMDDESKKPSKLLKLDPITGEKIEAIVLDERMHKRD